MYTSPVSPSPLLFSKILSIAAVLILEIITPIGSSPLLLSSAKTGEITIIFLPDSAGSNSIKDSFNPL